MRKNKIRNTNSNNKQYEDEYEPTKKWFNEINPDPKQFPSVTEQILIELKDEAKKCHDSEVLHYNTKNSKTNSNFQWMKTVMHKGTVSDKIAAHTVAIQDNPVCNLETIRNLIAMVKVGKKKECTAVIETLTELFLSDLLRPNEKLKPFHRRPLSLLNELTSGNAITRKKILCTWYFEDQLKELYTAFVLALNTAAQDTVESNKEKAISAMYKLLAGNSEQEQNLLKYIVNKLGDPSAKVASKAIYCLTQLLLKHSNMQGVVLNEIEKILFRPNISTRAQYYSLCFLSQFYLSHEGSEVARRLIEVYFSFFKACIKKGDIDSRMMSALLIGINRAYPYAKIELDKVKEHIDTIYRLVHIATFNISLHALTILYQVSDFGNSINDRYFNALYKKLLDPQVLITTNQAMLLSLIYKTLLKDTEVNRIKMFIKRLLQISLYAAPNFATGILFLISQLISKKENIQHIVLKQSINSRIDGEGDDDEEEKYHDVDDKDTVEKLELQTNDNLSENVDEDVKPDIDDLKAALSGPSWYHVNKNKPKCVTKYDPVNRNPLYGGIEFTAYTELVLLKNHFHPTVSLYASNILLGDTIKYSGDPLKDFTLIRFLDRFVFKNPRKIDEKSGVNKLFAKRKIYRPKGVKMLPVNSADYLNQSLINIPAEELFLHTYLQKRYKDGIKSEKDEDDSDLESVQSEEFEEMLDKMAGVNKADDDIDFMNEIGQNMKKKGKKQKVDDELSSEEEELSEDDFDDEEDNDDFLNMNDDDKDLLNDLTDDDEEEDMEFENDTFKKGKKGDVSSIFASAEEFASLLEDEGSSKIAPGGSNAYANKDNADLKQIDWEDKRNKWLHGFNNAVGYGKGKKFGKRRKDDRPFPNKNKRIKKK